MCEKRRKKHDEVEEKRGKKEMKEKSAGQRKQIDRDIDTVTVYLVPACYRLSCRFLACSYIQGVLVILGLLGFNLSHQHPKNSNTAC